MVALSGLTVSGELGYEDDELGESQDVANPGDPSGEPAVFRRRASPVRGFHISDERIVVGR